ncbi:hypothetical protein CISG_01541 [Coccidioides immitis RMSCC 3703]|uniref:Uncharacterized protein n=1 Tax=Coccidioides immitis RMSCC 3703 TaxID=454286 RepID=A0A0J8R0C5_COCIT|nr:hypothetical protein CISG_01541 [Coccidioides immitis RMSCC 3703]
MTDYRRIIQFVLFKDYNAMQYAKGPWNRYLSPVTVVTVLRKEVQVYREVRKLSDTTSSHAPTCCRNSRTKRAERIKASPSRTVLTASSITREHAIVHRASLEILDLLRVGEEITACNYF